MANLSDAFASIKVDRVGNEFLEFLRAVQKEDYTYKLIEMDTLSEAEVDKRGNLNISFDTYGRWSYSSNIEGYLSGNWLHDEDAKAYEKFCEAIKKKDGSVEIEYSDSDTAMDWMGSGSALLETDATGKVKLSLSFGEEPLTIISYAEKYGLSEIEAMISMFGDDVADAYEAYVKEWRKDHDEGEPAGPAEWYDNEYQEVK